jgi:hypothetical protein
MQQNAVTENPVPVSPPVQADRDRHDPASAAGAARARMRRAHGARKRGVEGGCGVGDVVGVGVEFVGSCGGVAAEA